jgi:hypothetical protein
MSLKTQGLLVAVTITKPQLTAKDDKATGDAEAMNNARGAGQYRKDLYPKHLVAPITEVESQVRAYIRGQTLPWGTNSRLLPATKYMDFVTRLAQFEIAFGQAVTVFMQNYTSVLAAAQQQQGALYDPNLYPDVSELRAQFTFAPRFMPITDDGDFRVQITQEEVDMLKAQARQQVEQDTNAMAAEAVTRLKQTVAALAEAMGRPTRATIAKHGGVEIRPPIFRDSIVENITDVTELLKGFASMLPPKLVDLIDATAPLGKTNPESLRTDDQLRAAMKSNAESLLAEIDAAMGGPAPVLVKANPTGLQTVIPAPAPLDALEASLDAVFAVAPPVVAAPVPSATPSWLDELDFGD